MYTSSKFKFPGDGLERNVRISTLSPAAAAAASPKRKGPAAAEATPKRTKAAVAAEATLAAASVANSAVEPTEAAPPPPMRSAKKPAAAATVTPEAKNAPALRADESKIIAKKAAKALRDGPPDLDCTEDVEADETHPVEANEESPRATFFRDLQAGLTLTLISVPSHS